MSQATPFVVCKTSVHFCCVYEVEELTFNIFVLNLIFNAAALLSHWQGEGMGWNLLRSEFAAMVSLGQDFLQVL